MENKRFWSALLLTVLVLPLMFSCSKDDDLENEGYNVNVVVKDDGTTSNGSIFSAIDDKNYYLDYIKYTVTEGHLAVSGYDRAGFKGDAKIVSGITYKGNTYEVLEIKEYAFSGCRNLTSITIPNSVTCIGNSAFYNCSGLTSITIPNSVTSIGNYAFDGCTNISTVEYHCPSVENWFYSAKETITNVIIGDEVVTIGNDAFDGFTGLTSITIPNSVTSIGYSAFSGCSGLEKIVVDQGNTVYDSRDKCNAIIETESNTIIAGCKNTIIPNSVTSIVSAFSGCTGLTSIIIPNNVTSIGYATFSGCTGLTSITIPNSVTSIGYATFLGCKGLTSITIPNSVTSIGNSAFGYCTGLTSIHCQGATPPTIYDPFDTQIYSSATLYVPTGCLNAYKESYWKRFKNIVEE